MKMSITRFHFWRNRIGWEVILFPVFSNRNYEFGTGPVLNGLQCQKQTIV